MEASFIHGAGYGNVAVSSFPATQTQRLDVILSASFSYPLWFVLNSFWSCFGTSPVSLLFTPGGAATLSYLANNLCASLGPAPSFTPTPSSHIPVSFTRIPHIQGFPSHTDLSDFIPSSPIAFCSFKKMLLYTSPWGSSLS